MCSILKPGLIFLVCAFLITLSCEKNTTPLAQNNVPAITVALNVEDVTCTETWLRLTAENLPQGAGFGLLRGDSAVASGILNNGDTLLYDAGLLPGHDYSYQAFVLKDEMRIAKGKEQNVTTMDTTSHDFQLQTFEFPSPYGSASLYDVAIVNENDIWACGEIYADSTQPWLPYNAVHWDGQQWELRRIPFKYQGSNFWGPIYTVIAFSEDDVWFGIGSVIHWDGSTFNSIKIPDKIFPSRINKMWGNPETGELYVVGNQGKIAWSPDHGQSWQALDSGTDLPIQDIWGAKNEKTGEWEILCVAARLDQNEGSALLKIDSDGVEELQTEGLSWSLKAVWFIPGVIYYIGGDGLYPSRNLTANWKRDLSLPFLYKHAVRGQAVNDVIVAGSFGLLSHFNGMSWRHYNDGHFPSTSAAYRAVAIHNDLIVAVGYYNLRNGIVAVGRRN